MTVDSDYSEFSEIEEKLNQVNPVIVKEMVETENMPPFQFREQFRPVLIMHFNLMTGRSGSYVQAEQLTKEYFEKYYDIPQNAWNYRNRKPS